METKIQRNPGNNKGGNNKNVMILVALLLLVIVGGVAWWYLTQNVNNECNEDIIKEEYEKAKQKGSKNAKLILDKLTEEYSSCQDLIEELREDLADLKCCEEKIKKRFKDVFYKASSLQRAGKNKEAIDLLENQEPMNCRTKKCEFTDDQREINELIRKIKNGESLVNCEYETDEAKTTALEDIENDIENENYDAATDKIRTARSKCNEREFTKKLKDLEQQLIDKQVDGIVEKATSAVASDDCDRAETLIKQAQATLASRLSPSQSQRLNVTLSPCQKEEITCDQLIEEIKTYHANKQFSAASKVVQRAIDQGCSKNTIFKDLSATIEREADCETANSLVNQAKRLSWLNDRDKRKLENLKRDCNDPDPCANFDSRSELNRIENIMSSGDCDEAKRLLAELETSTCLDNGDKRSIEKLKSKLEDAMPSLTTLRSKLAAIETKIAQKKCDAAEKDLERLTPTCITPEAQRLIDAVSSQLVNCECADVSSLISEADKRLAAGKFKSSLQTKMYEALYDSRCSSSLSASEKSQLSDKLDQLIELEVKRQLAKAKELAPYGYYHTRNNADGKKVTGAIDRLDQSLARPYMTSDKKQKLQQAKEDLIIDRKGDILHQTSEGERLIDIIKGYKREHLKGSILARNNLQEADLDKAVKSKKIYIPIDTK